MLLWGPAAQQQRRAVFNALFGFFLRRSRQVSSSATINEYPGPAADLQNPDGPLARQVSIASCLISLCVFATPPRTLSHHTLHCTALRSTQVTQRGAKRTTAPRQPAMQCQCSMACLGTIQAPNLLGCNVSGGWCGGVQRARRKGCEHIQHVLAGWC